MATPQSSISHIQTTIKIYSPSTSDNSPVASTRPTSVSPV